MQEDKSIIGGERAREGVTTANMFGTLHYDRSSKHIEFIDRTEGFLNGDVAVERAACDMCRAKKVRWPLMVVVPGESTDSWRSLSAVAIGPDALGARHSVLSVCIRLWQSPGAASEPPRARNSRSSSRTSTKQSSKRNRLPQKPLSAMP